MKILSRTIGDGRVIELTRDEFGELMKLASALEGKTATETNWSFQIRNDLAGGRDEIDFSGVFGAVLAFYQATFRLNELRTLVCQFADFLDVKK